MNVREYDVFLKIAYLKTYIDYDTKRSSGVGKIMMLAFTRPFEIFLKTDEYFNITTDSYKMYVPYSKFELKNNPQDPKSIKG